MMRAVLLVALFVTAACGPSLWSVGGAPAGAAPGFGGGGDSSTGGGGDPYADPLSPANMNATDTTEPDDGKEGRMVGSSKAQSLRRAGDLLARAESELARGNATLAEQLFSMVEVFAGPDAVAELASQFRTGAPPRVTEAPKQAVDAGPQAKAVGSSDDEDTSDPPEPEPDPEPQPPPKGTLDGTLRIAGGAPGGALAFVTLEPLDRKWRPRKKKERVMEQRERQFGPRLMLIPVGSTVSFPNFDTVFHNVFSTSPAGPFDLGLYKQNQSRGMTFTDEGIVRIGCNLHANMSATIVVIAAPHYVFTGDDGSFRFRSLRPGKYRLRGWSEKTREPIVREITIASGPNKVTVDVAADAKGGPLPDKFGRPRKK
jgi:plastocyanin